jgi:hypothetical protein
VKPSQLDALWGATLHRTDLDILHQALVLTIGVSSSSGDTAHILQCAGLLELRYFSSIPGPWEYAEVTEIHTSTTPSGAHQIEIVLWSEDAGLVVIADTITLDGEDIGS